MSKAYRIWTMKPTTIDDVVSLPDGDVHVNYANWDYIGDISASTADSAYLFIKNKEPHNHVMAWEVEDYNAAIADFCIGKDGAVEDLGEGGDFISMSLAHNLADGRDAFYLHRADLTMGRLMYGMREAVVFFGNQFSDLDYQSTQVKPLKRL